MAERRGPKPLGVKIKDLSREARELIEDLIDYLVMDSEASSTISDYLYDWPIERRKEAIVELLEKGYLKIEFSEDGTKFRWLIWKDGFYRPL